MEKTLIPVLIILAVFLLAKRAKVSEAILRPIILNATNPYYLSIIQYTSQYDLDPDLVKAIIFAESSGRPEVVGKDGEVGLMQLGYLTRVDVARELKVPIPEPGELFDPHKNIQFGTTYLNILKKRFPEEEAWGIVSSYNQGSPRRKPDESFLNQGYVDKVKRYYDALKGGGLGWSLKDLMLEKVSESSS